MGILNVLRTYVGLEPNLSATLMDNNGWHSRDFGMDSEGYVFHKPWWFAPRTSLEDKRRWRYIRQSEISGDFLGRLYDQMQHTHEKPMPLSSALGKPVIGFAVAGALLSSLAVYRHVTDPTPYRERRLERPLGTIRIERPPEEIIEDINGNGLPERYIVIGGKRHFLEIDGKPVVESLQQK